MPHDTVEMWKTEADAWMLEKVRSDAPPATLEDCRRDPQSAIYHFYAEKSYANENIDFLDAVDAFRQSPNADVAQKIYDDYVRSGILNLFSRQYLDNVFGEDVLMISQDMFNEAFDEIYVLTNQDQYDKFKKRLPSLRQELGASESNDTESDATDVEVGQPEKVELTRDMIDDTVVDNYNQQALKDLDEGSDATFWQLGDLVIVAGYGSYEAQPYVKWIRDQDGVARGNINMTKKGGVFDPGSITVGGGGDRASFEAAIERISKKKIKYG